MSSERDKKVCVSEQSCEPNMNSHDTDFSIQPCPSTLAEKAATYPPPHKYQRGPTFNPKCAKIGHTPSKYIPPPLVPPALPNDAIVSSVSTNFSSLPSSFHNGTDALVQKAGVAGYNELPRRLQLHQKLPSFPSLPSSDLHLDGPCASSKEFQMRRIAELPSVKMGPSLVLPHLYIGSNIDALNPETFKVPLQLLSTGAESGTSRGQLNISQFDTELANAV